MLTLFNHLLLDKHFQMHYLISQKCSGKKLFLFPLQRWSNWGPKKEPKFIEAVNGRARTQTHFWHQVIFLFYFTLYEDKFWYFLLIRTSSSIFFKEKKLSMWLKYKCNLRLRNTAITAAKSLHLQVNSRKQSQAILPLKSEGHETSETLKWHSLCRNDKGKFLNFWPWRKTLRIKFLQNFIRVFIFSLGFMTIT